MYSVVAADGKVYGPVDVSTLKNWCVEGRVRPETNVVDGISGRTYLAEELQDLYGTFEFSGIQPPPPPGVQPGLAGPLQTVAYGPPSNRYAPYQPYSPYVQTGAVKSKLLAILLAFFFGVFGAHRFYLGHTSKGAASLMLAVFGFICLASIVAIPLFILIFCRPWRLVVCGHCAYCYRRTWRFARIQTWAITKL
jgi:TM2 domain-containing membrane protein YozV